ncbi:LRR domain containing protein [Trema orientale]|uniref:Cell wall hydroxyproline-rich glycoprotein n=1 Tax=Trema orientale TaxID=63057 RepID=A0A2P5DNJ5_TREOI|nr:LRR domain containing protein [Trema orientale]
MASFSLSFLIFLLHFSSFLNNIMAAKHNHHHDHHHHINHNHSSPSTSNSSDSNPRLHQAFIALQAWKRVIYSDPNNFTSNWLGPSVCNYTGIYCAPSIDNPDIRVVAGIDLNHADIAGFLPDELGLLTDLALIHLNSNRFCGIVPSTFSNLSLLYELDLSNNRFVGPFPTVVLSLPTLNYLDIRFNDFEGPLPPKLFSKKLDAVFVNNNRFTSLNIPQTLTASTSASVLVFANNNYGKGKKFMIPPSIVNFANSLEELVLTNTNLSGCLPQEIGFLYKLKVFDVSFNQIVGPIPYSMAGLFHLEQLNLGHNMMGGAVPAGICELPNLANLTVSYNFFCEEDGVCLNLTSSRSKSKTKGVVFDDRRNCLPERRFQRSEKECSAALERPVDCEVDHGFGAGGGGGAAFAPVPAAVPLPSAPSLSPAHS